MKNYKYASAYSEVSHHIRLFLRKLVLRSIEILIWPNNYTNRDRNLIQSRDISQKKLRLYKYNNRTTNSTNQSVNSSKVNYFYYYVCINNVMLFFINRHVVMIHDYSVNGRFLSHGFTPAVT